MQEEKFYLYYYCNRGDIPVTLCSYYRYSTALDFQRNEVCNGAGPRRFGKLIPDTFWGLCITEPANNHDWDYQWGVTIEDKKQADRTFRNNMLRCAEALRAYEASKNPGWFKRKVNDYYHIQRCDMIEEYFKAVDSLGGPSFWDKTKISFNWECLAETE